MKALQIPVVHYPQGNPYGTRSWPELGWRSLFRHMYRRQLFWSDLADRQPESEQHACILQFLGIAEHLFSAQYGEMVGLEKKIQQLQSEREQFIAMLQEVSRELIDEKELGVALTPVSIEAAINRHEEEIAALQKQRQAALAAVLDRATAKTQQQGDANGADKGIVERLGEELAALRARQEPNLVALRKTQGRLDELRTHRNVLAEELGRMERAREAGHLLSNLRITHCPACDREINEAGSNADHCYLCKRPNEPTIPPAADKRLDFELQQLRGEVQETGELIEVMAKEAVRLSGEHAKISEQVRRIENNLRPVTTAAAAVLPPELGVYDQDTGRLRERITQLHRIRATLNKRENIASQIETIQTEVAALRTRVTEQAKAISFERAGDVLSDGMNTYLNQIKARNPGAWTQQEVDVILRDRDFTIRIGKSNWRAKLGGTLTLYCLIAYHYALLTLTTKSGCHYPGICILDFPPELDGVLISDSENFVLEPFVKLLAPDGQPGQVIAAGSSFAGLEGANRIQFTNVWV